MSEKIINGDFSDELNNWDNGVNENPFLWFEAERAYCVAISTTLKKYDMKQDFSSVDEVIAGITSIYCKWTSYSEDTDGYVRFIIKLEKPDTSEVTLVDVTKTAVVGEGYILENEDITAHFDQYGNHKLWINCWLIGAKLGVGFRGSSASIWTVSLDSTVKKYKSVHEKVGSIGSSSPHPTRQSTTASDIVAISEDYSMKVEKPVNEIIGLVESYSTEVRPMQFTSASEAIGLIEGMTKVLKPTPTAESISLVERIQAKRTHGNLVTTYTIEDLVGWDEVSPTVTPWIKTKIIT